MLKNNSFDDCFEVVLADTPESKALHFNLRYQVYCEEMKYEDKTKYAHQMEYDEWDEYATHFLVRSQYSGSWLGAVRIVFGHKLQFPFEQKCRSKKALSRTDYYESAEISRLCVIKEARRFTARNEASKLDPCQTDLKTNIRYLYKLHAKNQSLMWGLLKAAAVYSCQQGIKYWYFLATPSLAHCLEREKFTIQQQMGTFAFINGKRNLYKLNVEEFIANSMWQTDYKKSFTNYSKLTAETAVFRHSA